MVDHPHDLDFYLIGAIKALPIEKEKSYLTMHSHYQIGYQATNIRLVISIAVKSTKINLRQSTMEVLVVSLSPSNPSHLPASEVSESIRSSSSATSSSSSSSSSAPAHMVGSSPYPSSGHPVRKRRQTDGSQRRLPIPERKKKTPSPTKNSHGDHEDDNSGDSDFAIEQDSEAEPGAKRKPKSPSPTPNQVYAIVDHRDIGAGTSPHLGVLEYRVRMGRHDALDWVAESAIPDFKQIIAYWRAKGLVRPSYVWVNRDANEIARYRNRVRLGLVILPRLVTKEA